MKEILKCPCCNELLKINNNHYECLNKHCFDIASKGYVNLLLANQKHSLDPGDSKQSILSRVDFLSHDYYFILKDGLYQIIKKHHQLDNLDFIDLACGEGYYTTYIHTKLANDYNIQTVGIDISKQAIIEACKKRNANKLANIDFVIANIFNLPFIENSFDVALNCFAPIAPEQFCKILKENGLFIRVLPDSDHLYELKEVLYEHVILNVMKEKELKGFRLIDEIHLKDKVYLKSQEEINQLLMMTPYCYKSPIAGLNRLKQKESLETTISFVALVYRKDNT